MNQIKKLSIVLISLLFFSCSEDIELQKNESIATTTETRQAVIDGILYRPCVEITVFIEPSCHDNWIDGTAGAIEAYNNVQGAAIKMTQVYTRPADIEISCDYYPKETFIGLGEWPEEDYAIGEHIFINEAYDIECEGNMCWYQGVMMHEFGHNLGFIHGDDQCLAYVTTGPHEVDPATGKVVWEGIAPVNTTPNINLAPIHVAGTANKDDDENSVFNDWWGDMVCDKSICSFSFFDKLALKTIYPDPFAYIQIIGDNDLCFSGESKTTIICLSNVPSNATFSVTSELPSNVLNNNCIEFNFNSVGNFATSFEFCIDDCCEIINTNILVNSDCCSTCYCDCIDDDGSPIREEIPCSETTSCADLFAGDRYDCVRAVVPTEFDYTLTGDEEICVVDGYGTFCVNGLPVGTSTSWIIYGPEETYKRDSPNNCLAFDLNEAGIYTITTEVCNGECCQTLIHTIVVSNCSECYCECWEENYKSNIRDDKNILYPGYHLVQVPIDCDEDCEDVYDGDSFKNCVKKSR